MCEHARLGSLHTPHGTVQTPNFIFCATKASVKALPAHVAHELGVEILLSNTYHLALQPGSKRVQEQGGLHSFMGWKGPLLSDSGGYQVFSMGHGSVSAEIKKSSTRSFPNSIEKISEEGVAFKSYVDGSRVFLSPESSIQTQRELGTDIILQFDECTPYHVDKGYTKLAMERSLRWGKRSMDAFLQENTYQQALYGILQGGVYPDLRKISAEETNKLDFFGNAIGGSLGQNKEEMHRIVEQSTSLLERSRPVHLLGIGDLKSIFWGVRCGVDTFDCVHPTRIARHAIALLPAAQEASGKLNLRNSVCKDLDRPVDENCPHPCCKHYSQAYLHHLFKARELLGMQLLSMHNIGFMLRVMKSIRNALASEDAQKNLHVQEQYWAGA